MVRFALAAILLTACSGDGEAPDDTGATDSDTEATDSDTGFGSTDGVDETDTGTPSAVSFAADIAPITGSACAGCHTTDANGGFADADTHGGWTASSSIGLAYCEPGDPASSYGYLKIAGTQADAGGAGSQMPLGGSLSAAEVELFEAWVLDGCQP